MIGDKIEIECVENGFIVSHNIITEENKKRILEERKKCGSNSKMLSRHTWSFNSKNAFIATNLDDIFEYIEKLI